MSDKALMYRLLQENNIQACMDLFDMVVDEYAKEVDKWRSSAEKAEARVVELENSWLVDESIQPDGSLRPSVKTEAENKRLREVLEWYADKENYRSYYEKNAAAMKEKGERARLALGNNNELDDYTY